MRTALERLVRKLLEGKTCYTGLKADFKPHFEYKEIHTGQCKSTGGGYSELVVAIFRTGAGVQWQKR